MSVSPLEMKGLDWDASYSAAINYGRGEVRGRVQVQSRQPHRRGAVYRTRPVNLTGEGLCTGAVPSTPQARGRVQDQSRQPHRREARTGPVPSTPQARGAYRTRPDNPAEEGMTCRLCPVNVTGATHGSGPVNPCRGSYNPCMPGSDMSKPPCTPVLVVSEPEHFASRTVRPYPQEFFGGDPTRV